MGAHFNDRIRKLHALQQHWCFLIAQRVPCDNILESCHSHNVTCTNCREERTLALSVGQHHPSRQTGRPSLTCTCFFGVLTRVCMHLHQAANALLLPLGGVQYVAPGLHHGQGGAWLATCGGRLWTFGQPPALQRSTVTSSTPEYTRMNVREPTNGSVMILNARAEKGSSSLDLRVMSCMPCHRQASAQRLATLLSRAAPSPGHPQRSRGRPQGRAATAGNQSRHPAEAARPCF